MHRYYIQEPAQVNSSYQLSKTDSHHLEKVLRLNPGDQIQIIDSQSQAYLGQVSQLGDLVTVQIISQLDVVNSEMPVEVTIAVGLSKGDKLDWIAQKGTESGMSKMIPLALKRDVVKWAKNKADKKVQRLNKITDEASKQAKRLTRPQVEDLHTLNDLVELAPGYDWLILANEEKAHQGQYSRLKEILSKIKSGDKVLAVFGSEGGFDSEEVQLLEENGFISCSLGPRILRAETAPLYLLHAVSYVSEL